MPDYTVETRITDAYPEKGHWKITLEKNPFYPGGGGQPCDTGHLQELGAGERAFSCHVSGAEENENGTIFLVCEPVSGLPEPGMRVEAKIDTSRRERYTKLHTCEHILFRAIQHQQPELEFGKMELRDHDGTMRVKCHDLTWKDVLAGERLANHTVHEDLPITERVVNRTDTHKYPLLRIREDRIPGDRIRVIQIGEFDITACKGTHCKRTSEVNGILVTSFNQAGPNTYDITFTADFEDAGTQQELFKLASAARLAAAAAGTDANLLEKTVANLKQEHAAFKQQLNEMLKSGALRFDVKRIGNTNLATARVTGLDKKQIAEAANTALHDGTIVVVLNGTGENVQISIFSKSNHDAGTIVRKINESLGGKGGGGKEFAMCSVAKEKEGEVINLIMAILRQ